MVSSTNPRVFKQSSPLEFVGGSSEQLPMSYTTTDIPSARDARDIPSNESAFSSAQCANTTASPQRTSDEQSEDDNGQGNETNHGEHQQGHSYQASHQIMPFDLHLGLSSYYCQEANRTKYVWTTYGASNNASFVRYDVTIQFDQNQLYSSGIVLGCRMSFGIG